MTRSTKGTEGTNYQGVRITTSIDSLVEVIGLPSYTSNDEDYVTHIWDCETEEGIVFTIYTFVTEDDDSSLETTFRIGSFSKSISNKAKEEVESLF